MKRYFYAFFILVNAFFVFNDARGQNQMPAANFRILEVGNQAAIGGLYEVKIQISSAVSYQQGGFNIQFTFNTLGLSLDETDGFAHAFSAFNFSGGHYIPMTLTDTITPDQKQYMSLNGFLYQEPGTTVDYKWLDVALLKFTILDINQTTKMVFQPSDATPANLASLVYTSNGTAVPTGTLEGLDVPLFNTTVLPVTLLSFTAALDKQGHVALRWATATEKNNQEFQVERSTDGRHFSRIAMVAGAGNSANKLHYEARDRHPEPGINYYRLKQVDFNGDSEYSRLVAVNTQGAGALAISRVSPNPFGEKTEVEFQAVPQTRVDLTLLDAKGQVVSRQQFTALQARNSYTLDKLGKLSEGVYFLRLGNQDQVTTVKLIKN